jgi:hypothetical protein
VQFSPDGKLLATGHWDGVVCLWDSRSGKSIRQLHGHEGRVNALSFSPDGKTLLSAGDDDTPRLWDVASGRLLHELAGHQAEVLAVAFSLDGKRIASASADTTILIWDVPGLATLVRPPPSPPTAEELQGLWTDLGTEFGYTPAHRAMRRLIAAPKSALPFLRQRLKPDLPRDERFERLLADLDSDEFAVRENASRELARLGKKAEPALRRSLGERPSLEKRLRVEALLVPFAYPPRTSSRRTAEEQRLIRAAVVLDRIGTADALDLLRHLVYSTDLPAIMAGPFASRMKVQEAKAALERLANRPAKP